MKRLLSYVLVICSLASSCQKFDDSEIWNKLNNHEKRIAYLEELCEKMNEELANLQIIVTALESHDYVINASPLVNGDGYTLIFKSGKSIVIYNGIDGKDGVDGKDGTDGVTPTISVKEDSDGIYYWTIDGEWILVNGEKVRATAIDGDDGKDGVDGITPKFKIENDYWYISYDNGENWEMLGKAKGDDGLAGEHGDSIFTRVFIEDGCVCFELNDSEKTIIRLPLMKDGELVITLTEPGTLNKSLTSEETRTVTSLTIKGTFNLNDMRHIQIMNNLHKLDLSQATCGTFRLNPYRDTIINKCITEVVLPNQANCDLSYCLALQKVIIAGEKTSFVSDEEFCPNVSEFEVSEGVTNNTSFATNGWSASRLRKITYPSTLTTIHPELAPHYSFSQESLTQYVYMRTFVLPYDVIICKAITPPTVDDSKFVYYTDYDAYVDKGSGTRLMYKLDIPANLVLYVPAESIELYKTAPLWENFTNILPYTE